MLHIVCFGNIWQGDDGFGMHVFQRLCDLQSSHLRSKCLMLVPQD